VYLGDVSPEDVHVELYADPLRGTEHGERQDKPMRVIMNRIDPIAGAVNGFWYYANVSANRPAEDYTPRVVPYHPEALVPKEVAHILWLR